MADMVKGCTKAQMAAWPSGLGRGQKSPVQCFVWPVERISYNRTLRASRTRHVRWQQRRDEEGEPGMGTEENKAVVRQFLSETHSTGGNLDVLDELLAPNYENLAMGGADLAGTKAGFSALIATVKDLRLDVEELVAEGDAVFARVKIVITVPDGSTTTARGLAYYRLADGRIVVNDATSVPDLMQVLGPLMAPPPGAES